MKKDKNRVCPVELSGSLEGKFRRLLQNPKNILTPYVKEGMTVLDIGCGPGFFSIEMANLVGKNGKVIAADLQEGMLKILGDKIRGSELEERIILVKSEKDKICVTEKVDFILAFYVVHEIVDKDNLFAELKNILNENGEILIVEPKLFHVSEKEFQSTLDKAEKTGLKIKNGPRLPFSWSAILSN